MNKLRTLYANNDYYITKRKVSKDKYLYCIYQKGVTDDFSDTAYGDLCTAITYCNYLERQPNRTYPRQDSGGTIKYSGIKYPRPDCHKEPFFMSPSEYTVLENQLIDFGWVKSNHSNYNIKFKSHHLIFKQDKVFLSGFHKGKFHAPNTFFYDSGIDTVIDKINKVVKCNIPPTNHKYTNATELMDHLVNKGWGDITNYPHYPYVALKGETCIKIDPNTITLFTVPQDKYSNTRFKIDRTSISDTIISINGFLKGGSKI